jgi:hypothetical protein
VTAPPRTDATGETAQPAQPAQTAETAQIVRLALRAYLRYAVPLTLLAAVVLAPWLGLALGARPPADLAGARAALRATWLLGATAWIGQLLLVGAAAPLVRALDAGAPLSQLRALGRGARQLVRAAVPWLAAVAAIALGGLALALPGLALLVLFSTTAASTRGGLPAPLAESAALVRRKLPLAAGAVAALLAADLGAVYLAQALLRPEIAGKLRPDQLAMFRRMLEVVAIAITLMAPPIAALLAAMHARAART